MRTYYVYILTNRRGTLYAGVTNDLARRLFEHRQRTSDFTSRYRIDKLLYFEAASSPVEAISREKQIKGWVRSRKLELIRAVNPAMRDLAPEVLGWRARPFSVPRSRSG